MDWGLLAGVGGMLNSGVDSYTKALHDRVQRDSIKKLRDIESQRNQINMAEHGYEADPDTGDIRMSQEGRQKQQYGYDKESLEQEGKALSHLNPEIVAAVPGLLKAQTDYVQRARNFGQNRGLLAQPKGVLPDPMDSKEGLLTPEPTDAETQEKQTTAQAVQSAPPAPHSPQGDPVGAGAAVGAVDGANLGFLGPQPAQRAPMAAPMAPQAPAEPDRAPDADPMALPPGFKTMRQKQFEALEAYKTATQKRMMTDQEEKWAESLKKDIDPDASRSGNFGEISKNKIRAQRIQTLVGDYVQNPARLALDKRQVEEMAIGVSALMGGSGSPSESTIHALVPQTLWGDVKGIAEWIANKPLGKGQQEFVKRMAETVNRESDLASQQMKEIQVRRLSRHSNLAQSNPDKYLQMLEDNDLLDEDGRPLTMKALRAKSKASGILPSREGGAEDLSKQKSIPEGFVKMSINGKDPHWVNPAKVKEAEKDGYSVER